MKTVNNSRRLFLNGREVESVVFADGEVLQFPIENIESGNYVKIEGSKNVVIQQNNEFKHFFRRLFN